MRNDPYKEMRMPIEAIHERNDLDVINSELRREIRTLKAELNNAELRIAQLMESKGLPVKNADVLNPNC